MRIVQISDLHITKEGKKACSITPTTKNLQKCIKHINAITPSIDLILVTGDITNEGSLEETQRAKTILDNLNAPYYLTPGNHDNRDHLLSVFGEEHISVSSKGFINYVINKSAIRLVCLDSVIEGRSGAEFCDIRAAWLEKELKKETEKPTIIFMHHPPIKFGILETDQDGFIGAKRLGKIIQKQANILAILCGHVHLQTNTAWNGTVVCTSPSMGMQLLLDLTQTLPSQFFNTDPAYQLHYFTPEKELVSFAISTTKMNGPYPF